MMELIVKSTVIDWQEGTLTITDTAGSKHVLPLDKRIRVAMVGYPDREERTILARELAPYMECGYIIEHISFEEEEQP